jgi:nitrile hydratase
MNGVYDMGGMHGLGPIAPEQNEPVFHEPWEGRIFALFPATAPWDAGRSMPPARKLNECPPPITCARYYEKWLYSLTENAIRQGLITREEAQTGRADPRAAKVTPPLTAAGVAAFVDAGSRAATALPTRRRDCDPDPAHAPAAFRAWQAWRHHRLARGSCVFPDTSAVFQGENAQPLYTVLHREVSGLHFVGRGRQSARHRLPRSVGGLS